MKKIIFLILLFTAVQLFAAEDYYYNRLTYDKFASWMQSINIRGFTLRETKIEGSVEVYNLEYVAVFVNDMQESYQIRISHPDIFYQFEDLPAYEHIGPYDFNGFPAVFIFNQKLTKPSNLTYIMINFTDLGATFSISAMTKKRLSQLEMENFAKNFNLSSLNQNALANWPDEIPIEFRLPGSANTITKLNSNDEVVKSEYKVVFEKTDDFVRSLRKFFKDKHGWLDLTTYKDINLVCNTTKEIQELEKMDDGKKIEFTYYIR